jgi:hypothetical protein
MNLPEIVAEIVTAKEHRQEIHFRSQVPRGDGRGCVPPQFPTEGFEGVEAGSWLL